MMDSTCPYSLRGNQIGWSQHQNHHLFEYLRQLDLLQNCAYWCYYSWFHFTFWYSVQMRPIPLQNQKNDGAILHPYNYTFLCYHRGDRLHQLYLLRFEIDGIWDHLITSQYSFVSLQVPSALRWGHSVLWSCYLQMILILSLSLFLPP